MPGSARIYLGAGSLALVIGIASARFPQVPAFARGVLYGIAGGLLFAALLKSCVADTCDNGTPALRRRYLREFVPATIGYLVSVFASVWLLRLVETPVPRALVALLPVPSIAMAMRAIVRRIRDSDELQRQIELEAVSLATACVSLCYLAAGFLQTAHVIDVPAGDALIWMFPLVCLSYGLIKLAVMRRYR